MFCLGHLSWVPLYLLAFLSPSSCFGTGFYISGSCLFEPSRAHLGSGGKPSRVTKTGLCGELCFGYSFPLPWFFVGGECFGLSSGPELPLRESELSVTVRRRFCFGFRGFSGVSVFPGLKVYVAGGVGFSRHSLSASVGRETTNAHMRGALWVGGVGVRYDLPARGLFVVAEGAFFFPRSLSVPPYSKTGPISASGVKSWGLKLGCGYKF